MVVGSKGEKVICDANTCFSDYVEDFPVHVLKEWGVRFVSADHEDSTVDNTEGGYSVKCTSGRIIPRTSSGRPISRDAGYPIPQQLRWNSDPSDASKMVQIPSTPVIDIRGNPPVILETLGS